jgi:hypothetical protein
MFKKTLSALVCASLLMGSLPVNAAMLATDAGVEVQTEQADRAQLLAFLQREDVRDEMVKMGVSAADAEQRVAALSDAEVRELNGRLDTLPAGSSDVLGLMFTVFIVLLVTDILGLTKVFPFTRSVR